MTNSLKNSAPLANTLMEQFKSKGYTCQQVKENEVTLIIIKHGRRQETNIIAFQPAPR
ncbi:MAG: hypothetical protein ACXWC7_15970 [Chitinophagaceae bacterium]